MICRYWRGWTTPENANAYESVVRDQVIPDIEARGIPGFLHIDLMRRDLGDEIEFATMMWFDRLESIIAFTGDDPTLAHVPEPARQVLKRFDPRSAHYEVLDRRDQSRLDYMPNSSRAE